MSIIILMVPKERVTIWPGRPHIGTYHTVVSAKMAPEFVPVGLHFIYVIALYLDWFLWNMWD